jgi:GTP-binding protein
MAEFKQYAFVGRSNVGKSSLINHILGSPVVKSSKTPGKTRNLHFIDLPNIKMQLVDCPGYGFAKAGHTEKEQWKKFMLKFLMNSKLLHRVMVLVDLSVGLQESDKLLIEMLTELKLVFMIVLTKADRLKTPREINAKMEDVVGFMKQTGSMCVPIVHCVSAEAGGYGLYELMANLLFHHQQENYAEMNMMTRGQ